MKIGTNPSKLFSQFILVVRYIGSLFVRSKPNLRIYAPECLFASPEGVIRLHLYYLLRADGNAYPRALRVCKAYLTLRAAIMGSCSKHKVVVDHDVDV